MKLTCALCRRLTWRAQVLLRERCLLVVGGEAYQRCEHSIPTRSKDAVSPACCNAAQARLTLLTSTAVTPRTRRTSLNGIAWMWYYTPSRMQSYLKQMPG